MSNSSTKPKDDGPYIEEFYNYKEEKAFWFAIYLELAAAICEHPYLSAKNSDFKDNVKRLDFPINIEEDVRTYDTHGK